MIKKLLIGFSFLFLFFCLSTATVTARGKGQQKNSPFLITGKMPHLTKLLMQQWNNTELHLTEEQKEKLLIVREETIGGVQQLGKKIAVLEQQIADESLAGKLPREIKPLVQQVEKLKGEATMIHLHCIYKTSIILNKEQLAVLKR